MFKNLLFCGWTTAKLTTLKHFGFIFNYSGFLVNNTSIFNGCVITASFMLPTFICFSFHNFYFGNFNLVFQNQTIITILVVPMLTNHNNVPWPLFDRVKIYMNCYRVVKRLKTWDLRKFENIKKMSKLPGIIA